MGSAYKIKVRFQIIFCLGGVAQEKLKGFLGSVFNSSFSFI